MVPSIIFGRVTEWSIVAVSKTVVRVSVPGVQIPPLPPADLQKNEKIRAIDLCNRWLTVCLQSCPAFVEEFNENSLKFGAYP